MLGHSKTRLVTGVMRSFSTAPRVRASHYDILGVTPKATQNDIKTAYYKLSKIHHPDKSKDETSAKKFRAINEAYEVLGNVKLKKMYDKGLLVGRENTSRMEYEPEPTPTDPTLKFYKSREQRHVAPTMDGKTPIYDFDTWSKQHYGEVFQKSQYEKEYLRRKKERIIQTKNAVHQDAIMYMLFAMLGLFVIFVYHGKTDYDLDTTQKRKIQQTQSKE